ARLIRSAQEAGLLTDNWKRAVRRVEDYRERRLLPHPTRVGQEGRRGIWLYPQGTAKQPIALLPCAKRTPHNLQATPAHLVAEASPSHLTDARAAILHVVGIFQMALAGELARFVPKNVDPAALFDQPEALLVALEGWAGELARMRSRFPIPRDLSARMTLEE